MIESEIGNYLDSKNITEIQIDDVVQMWVCNYIYKISYMLFTLHVILYILIIIVVATKQ